MSERIVDKQTAEIAHKEYSLSACCTAIPDNAVGSAPSLLSNNWASCTTVVYAWLANCSLISTIIY